MEFPKLIIPFLYNITNFYMDVYKDNRPTKDGKIWFYKAQYEDIDGTHKTKKSGRYATKKEAEDSEFELKLKLREYENTNNVTFEEKLDYNCMFEKFGMKQGEEDKKNGFNLQGTITRHFYQNKVFIEKEKFQEQ